MEAIFLACAFCFAVPFALYLDARDRNKRLTPQKKAEIIPETIKEENYNDELLDLLIEETIFKNK